MFLLQAELSFALELAGECSERALAWFGADERELAAEQKERGQGLVTRADRELNAHIVTALRQRFPADAVLAEESAEDSDRRRRERCWMIDPIDGTAEYASKDPSFAIHIGLCVAGRPRLGVVAEPGHDRITWGRVDAPEPGAWTRVSGGEAAAIRVAGPTPGGLRLVSSKSHRSPRIDELRELLGVDPARHLRTGSTGVKICVVARGEADVYAHPTAGTSLWDTSAPEAVLIAAGGTLTDLLGRPLDYTGEDLGHKTGLLAGAAAGHAELAARLSVPARRWFSPTA